MGLLVAEHVGNKILSFEFFEEDTENIENKSHISRTSFLDFFFVVFCNCFGFQKNKK
jgi:hypothetical protein